jgi:hypothetical protein
LRGRSLLLLLFGLMLLVLGISWLVFKKGASLECTDAVVEELPSPDGRNVAARYERSCGEGSLATHVALHAAGVPPSFTPGDELYVAPGRPTLRVQWTGPRALTVEAPVPSAMPDRVQWHNVRVTVRVVRPAR